MDFIIEAVIAPKIGFASHQNSVPLVRELKVRLAGDDTVENCQLTLVSDPPFVQPKTWHIDRISPDDDVNISDRNVQLTATYLSGLSESVSASVNLSLSGPDGADLAQSTFPVELLAHNAWGGLSSMAELLPAYVMPNDPAIDRILKSASDALRRAGKPDALDGYKSKDRTRVWQTVSAIWSAVAGIRLSYALPPASFEREGQKVRTPSAILDGRLATCLDTALLFASALEQAGLNPILVLTNGHAFTGVWLQPVEFSALLTDEAAALRRRVDLNDLVVFETTLIANDPPAGFSQAIATAKREIAEDAAFEMAIDIRRARLLKIRPLGVVVENRNPQNDTTVSEGLEEAPQLPAFDVEVEDTPVTPSDRIQSWQRKLLNLTTTNRLLHVPDSAKFLRLICPDPGALEDMLADGHKVRVAPLPDLSTGGRDAALYETQTHASLIEEVARQTLDKREVLSSLGKEKLEAVLIDLFRRARTDLEEGGANTLFLALGFLKWKKSPNEEKIYRAPLILLPVKLDRSNARSNVVLVHHEDEPRFNLTLLEMLRQDFELTIPGFDGELPKDEHGIDVEGIGQTVRAAVRDMVGFEVVTDVVLGTFSFAKYLMWKDLTDRADVLKESPLVRHLIERNGQGFQGKKDFPKPEDLDDCVNPEDLYTPLPADSSQMAAIVASSRGHTFVLDGPPGCGKSQTIANMIAHNLALGRRVLFVAEKKAALEVVQRRLAEKGLAPFCLELHSAKATKPAVLKQLDQAWTTRDTLSTEEWQNQAAYALRLRHSLNDIARLLHKPDSSGWTVHRAIGLVVREGVEKVIRLGFPASTHHDAVDMTRFRDVVRRLGLARSEVDDLTGRLDGIVATTWSNAWQENIFAAAKTLLAALKNVEKSAQDLHTVTSFPIPTEDRLTLGRIQAFVRTLLDMHGHDLRFSFSPTMSDQVAAVREGLSLIAQYRTEEDVLSAPYAPEAVRRIDVRIIRSAWIEASGKFWFFATLAKRKVARSLALAGGVTGDVNPDNDLLHLSAMRELVSRIDGIALRTDGFPGWKGLATEAHTITDTIARGERLRTAIAAEADGLEDLSALRSLVQALVVDANDLLAEDGRIAMAVARLEQDLCSYDKAVSRFDALSHLQDGTNFAYLRACADAVVTNERRLKDWANWRRVRDEAIQANLLPLVEALECGRIASADTIEAFELAYAYWFAAKRIDEEPKLNTFSSNEHFDRILQFQKIVDRMGELASRYIRAKICGYIPDKEETIRNPGYRILRHQLQLQRAHMPIRKLVSEMGDAFGCLAPCMLMSPLSIAQYLPADHALFDLVIFDEASQITPWDAIGAMARGKQVVIAGDPRQMPPSNDFQRSTTVAADGDDDSVQPDLESILEECLAAGVPQHSLDWHYRSRHESLIAFSNYRYYEGNLVTFPPPETRPSAVSWVRVHGVWAKGSSRTNPIEAKAIVDETVRRLRNPAFVNVSGNRSSLGIITMNAEQMRLVEDLLDQARQTYPEIEPYFSDDCLEPVVVRNLETAQGDERDVIFLGVGFGPTEPEGKTMSMYFGKLNSQGGWRRLNVAITRARSEMRLFTSFDPGMIDLTRTAAQGVSDLKDFIEYADRGPRAIAEAHRGSVGAVESPFEEAVMRELRRRGWTVVPQVGVSKFRIDLGIVHPDRPGDFLLGVECDGASYHSAATARDRDKVRASILKGLGWNLLRVWSTDWWVDKQRAADRLHMAIIAELEKDRGACADKNTTAVA